MTHTHQSGRIYRSAKSYYALAKPAFEDNSILELHSMAVVANLAMCVELLLKASDAKVTKSPQGVDGPLGNAKIASNVRGHDLLTMFENLDSEIQAVLEHLFEEEKGKPLRPLLEKCRDYFVHARYFYEDQHQHSYDVGALLMLAEGLDVAFWKGFGSTE